MGMSGFVEGGVAERWGIGSKLVQTDYSRLFSPRAIAVVGASAHLDRIGGQPVKALADFGFRGAVYPVNPRYEEVKNLRCYPTVASIPKPCDVAVIAVSAKSVPAVIRECGQAGIAFAVVLSAGFKEIGAEGEALQHALEEAIRDSGVRVVGPNCQGFMNVEDAVYCGFGASFQYAHPKHGPVALVTQSGGFGYAVMSLAEASGVGFKYVISTGNEADLDTVEMIRYLIEREDVGIVATYLEGVRDGRALRALGRRALELGKPIVVWKVGNSRLGRRAAASHTANLTGSYELYRAAFREGGFLEVRDVDDLVDVAKAFGARHFPGGNGVGVISISGGAGVLLADRCDELGLELAPIGTSATRKLQEILPEFTSATNPIDVTAQVFNNLAIFYQVVELVLADSAIDLVIVVMASMHGPTAAKVAEQLAQVSKAMNKPVFVVSSAAANRAAEAFRILEDSKIVRYSTPGRAATAIAALCAFAEKARAARPPAVTPRSTTIARLLADDLERAGSEHGAKTLLRQYDIPVTREVLIPLGDVDRLAYSPLQFPLVVKLDSPDLPHKTEAGAVRVGIRDLRELKHAVAEMVASSLSYRPEARINGALIQELVDGVEVIAGGVNDPFFGPTVMVGLGGIFTEIFRDVAYRFAPFDPSVATQMLAELRAASILKGYRGGVIGDIPALADALSKLSWLLADHEDAIAEIDINPLFVRPLGRGVVAADALIVSKLSKYADSVLTLPKS